MTGNRLMEAITACIGDAPIESLPVAFGAVATDLYTGEEIWLREGQYMTAVRASSGMPGLFSPTWHDGRWLIDGGVVNPVPVSMCRALGADVVIAVDLSRSVTNVAKRASEQSGAAAAHGPTASGSMESTASDEGTAILKKWSGLVDGLVESFRARRTEPGLLEVMGSSVNIMQDRITRSQVFARRSDPRLAPERGADIHVHVTVSFEEAWRGAERRATITRHHPCQQCAGSGFHRVSETACVSCEGTGTERSVRGHMVFAKNCPRCAGTGILRQERCGACHGQGVAPRTEALTVPVPPGVADGATLRLAGMGHAGVRGGPPGDLRVDVHVEPHDRFRRDGDDVHMVLPIAVHEAGLGAKIDVLTPDGTARVRVPPMSALLNLRDNRSRRYNWARHL